jgi:hypothetical protein
MTGHLRIDVSGAFRRFHNRSPHLCSGFVQAGNILGEKMSRQGEVYFINTVRPA